MSFSGPRLKNDGVIKAWQNGLSARNHRHSLASISNGTGSAELYSYDLKIGERTPALHHYRHTLLNLGGIVTINRRIQFRFRRAKPRPLGGPRQSTR